MAANKLSYFPFYAADYLSDPAVLDMDADAEGCYVRLLANMWVSSTPGVVQRRHIIQMGAVFRVAADRQKEVIRQLSAAFDVAGEKWTQRRMVVEYKRAARLKGAQRKAANNTNAGKSADSNNVARSPSRSPSRSPGVEVEVEVEVEEKKKSASRLSPRNTNGNHAASESVNGFVKAAPKEIRSELDKLACWLVETGTDHPASVIAVLENYIQRRPEKPKAYYALSGPTRDAVIVSAAADRAEREHARLKRMGAA